jgi:hypothetical protein
MPREGDERAPSVSSAPARIRIPDLSFRVQMCRTVWRMSL